MRHATLHPRFGSGLGKYSGDSVPRCIDKDDLLSFSLERERRLRCAEGLLWVTIENDRNDYLVGDKRELDIPERKVVILEAEEPSCFQLD
ncbi:DUF2917 domain-containing protein [bacterium]|nr:DUF2917 domain-containing protein [bacterium]